MAKNQMAVKFDEAVRAKGPRKQLPKDTFKKIHDEALKDFSIEGIEFAVPEATIRRRVQRKSLEVEKNGPESPVGPMEDVLIEYVVQRQEAGQPMKPRELIALANSLIQNSILETALKKFQKNSKKPETGKLTTSWAQGFMSRHDKLLKTKRGYRMNHIRLKDLTTDNVQTMYDLTYEGFVRARVAVELPENEQYYVDKQGPLLSKARQSTMPQTSRFGVMFVGRRLIRDCHQRLKMLKYMQRS